MKEVKTTDLNTAMATGNGRAQPASLRGHGQYANIHVFYKDGVLVWSDDGMPVTMDIIERPEWVPYYPAAPQEKEPVTEGAWRARCEALHSSNERLQKELIMAKAVAEEHLKNYNAQLEWSGKLVNDHDAMQKECEEWKGKAAQLDKRFVKYCAQNSSRLAFTEKALKERDEYKAGAEYYSKAYEEYKSMAVKLREELGWKNKEAEALKVEVAELAAANNSLLELNAQYAARITNAEGLAGTLKVLVHNQTEAFMNTLLGAHNYKGATK